MFRSIYNNKNTDATNNDEIIKTEYKIINIKNITQTEGI